MLTSALACPAIGHAADDGESGTTPIVVTAGREEQAIDDVANSTSVITLGQLETRQAVAVSELLRTVPGVTISANGGLGHTTAINIRGADSDQTLALIDGVKINDPSSPGGGFNFGNLVAGNIERIEVVRGSQSVLWGSQAIGGVINIITREPTEALAADITGEYGWRDSARLVGNFSGRTGPLSLSLGSQYIRTDGFSTFNEMRGGAERDAFRQYAVNGKARLGLNDAISFDLNGWYADSKAGIDGFPAPAFAFADTPETTASREFSGYAGLRAAAFEGRLKNRVGYALTDIHRRNVDPTGGTAVETFNATGRNKRIEYQGIADLSDAVGATFGAETEKSIFRTSSFGSPPATASARIDSVYGQLTLKPVSGLTLNGGVRYDHHSRFGGETTLAASGIYSFNNGNTLVRGSYGEGFKVPSLFQLFSDFGNRQLDPERARSWDMGLTQRLLDGRLAAAVTWFQRRARNQIIFISCATPLTGICLNRPFGTFDNVARTAAKGLEFTVEMRPVEALRVQAAYSFINARDVITHRQLPRRPRQSVNLTADYDWTVGLKTGLTITHVGKSFDNASNTRALKDYVLVDLRAAYPITGRLEMFGRVENLFDEHYETAFRFGTPRRAGYAGVRYRL